MKLPNGYGTVYKLSGNRRRPWVVKKWINGKQKPLGYFAERQEAFEFLVSINQYTPERKITFAAVYQKWSAHHYSMISKASISGYEISYKHLRMLHSRAFASITYNELQEAIDSVGAGYCTKKKCRVLISQLYKFAQKSRIICQDLSQFLELPRHIPVYKKRPFTSREIGKLQRNVSEDNMIEDILILIYTGMRIGEYLSLAPRDINIRQKYIDVKKSKTLAGIRKIPIYHSIFPILVKRKSEGIICKYENYDAFRHAFDKCLKGLHIHHHTPHECRHTLASMLNRSGANETSIKMILGHARHGVTESVYIHKTLSDLRKAINKV